MGWWAEVVNPNRVKWPNSAEIHSYVAIAPNRRLRYDSSRLQVRAN